MIYSTNYFGWEPTRTQESPISVITENSHPIRRDDARLSGIAWWSAPDGSEQFLGRISSAWWGMHPHLALPDAEVTIAIGGNFSTLIPDLAERCIEELGDDDLLLMRHPWRDDIIEEARASLDSWRWESQPVMEQAESYIAAGHPRGWGLFHAGLLVRRDTPAMRDLNEAWWGEFCRWSSQTQISLPHLLRTSGVKWHTWPDAGQWRAQPFDDGWVNWGDLGVAA